MFESFAPKINLYEEPQPILEVLSQRPEGVLFLVAGTLSPLFILEVFGVHFCLRRCTVW